jgi:hypothetical protein
LQRFLSTTVWAMMVLMRPLKKRRPDYIGVGGLGVSPSFKSPPRLGDVGGWSRLSQQSLNAKLLVY